MEEGGKRGEGGREGEREGEKQGEGGGRGKNIKGWMDEKK